MHFAYALHGPSKILSSILVIEVLNPLTFMLKMCEPLNSFPLGLLTLIQDQIPDLQFHNQLLKQAMQSMRSMVGRMDCLGETIKNMVLRTCSIKTLP